MFSESRIDGPLPDPGRVDALLLFREDGRLVTGGDWAPCGAALTPQTLRKAALLDRYGAGRSAVAHVCDAYDTSCWSVRRERGDVSGWTRIGTACAFPESG